jgi:NAD(P)-dependent dehydrogenase (short-subunit alcohol dehydrogenase family)
MEPARTALAKHLAQINWGEPVIPVYSNGNAAPHVASPGEIRRTMTEHLTSPVLFAQTVERMHADGARIFLEVGPKTVLRDLTAAALLGKPHVAVSIDGAGGDFAGLIHALGILFVHGVPFSPAALTEGRADPDSKEQRALARRRAPFTPSEWLINGGGAKKALDAARSNEPATEPQFVKEAATKPKLSLVRRQNVQSGWVRITGLAKGISTTSPAQTYAQGASNMSFLGDGPPSGEDPNADPVMRQYFAMMSQFLQSQERVMKAYLSRGARPTFVEETAPLLAGNGIFAAPFAAAPIARAAQPAIATPAASIASADPVARTAGEPPKKAAPARDLKTLLVSLVSDRTGYPEDMLSLEADIEGDLGIDSIKRTEILGVMRKELPDALAPAFAERMGELAKAKSLGEIIGIVGDTIAKNGGGTAAQANGSAHHPFEQGGEEKTGGAVLPRFIVKAHAEPADDVVLADPLPGAYVILAGRDEALARRLASRIESAGGRSMLAPDALWRDAVAFGRWIGDIKTVDTVRALINLGPAENPFMPDHIDASMWRERVARDVKNFFPAIKVTADDLQRGGSIMAVSAMGGLFSRDADPSRRPWPIAAGNIGLLKCLSLEWTNARCKAVDLDPAENVEAQAHRVFQELFLPGGRREVGYPNGVRTIFRTVPSSVSRSPNPRMPASDWVVLAVGGGRGITAETLRGVAKAGATLVLVGRTGPPPEEAPELASFRDKAALRNYFIEKDRREGVKSPPAKIEAVCASIERDREVRSNLADFAAFGAKIDFRAADMRDGAAVRALLDAVYAKYGRIDAVFFGAGLIEDQLLENKSEDSVARVIDTKVDAAFHLGEGLRPQSLKFFCFFTSVAGRYGNRGQTDYGAANEILNQYAHHLQKRWGSAVKVAAVNWGPWAATTHGAGMVTDATARQFKARGVSLVGADAGLAFMTNEVVHAPIGEVEVVAGDNPWEYMEAAHGDIQNIAPDARLSRHPLLARRAVVKGAENSIVLSKRVDLVNDPYLDHHRIDGRPVMPFVVGAEHIAEAACLFDGFDECVELRDVRFFKGVSLTNGHADIEIRLKEIAPGLVEGEIWVLGQKPVRAYAARASRMASPAAVPRGDRSGAPFDKSVASIYSEWLFHGPSFQALKRIDGLDETSLLAAVRVSEPSQFYPPAAGGAWQFDPGVLDAALQTVLIWSRRMRDETSLPTRLGRLVRIGNEPLLGPVKIAMHFHTEPSVSSSVSDFTVSDAEGRIRYIGEKLEAASTSALNRIGGTRPSGFAKGAGK